MELQVWATWLLYAVLIDLTDADAVAEALNQPASAVSVEMVFRSLHCAADPCLQIGGPESLVGVAVRQEDHVMAWLVFQPRPE